MALGQWRVSAVALALMTVVWGNAEIAAAQSAQPSSGSPVISGGARGLGNGGAGLGNGASSTPKESAVKQDQSIDPDAAKAAEQAAEDAKADKDGVKATDKTAADKAKEAEEKAAEKPVDDKAEPDAAQAAAVEAEEAPSEIKGEVPKVEMPGNTGSNGNLSYDVGIAVPEFHGIEPSLTLNYNSSRKTRLGGLYQGWLGYAWGLEGIDVIERASAGYGTPFFDNAKDVFFVKV